MIGLIAGVLWLFTLNRIKGRSFSYMLTIAVLLLLYSAVEWVKGSGAIAALAFGLILGNGREISRMFKMEEMLEIDQLIKKFEDEITFFVRTFFFVYLGAVVRIKETKLIAVGVALSFILFLVRKIASTWVTMPRGLAAAALSVLPLSYGYKGAEIFPDIVFTVIVVTTVITTFGVFIFKSASKTKTPEQTKPRLILTLQAPSECLC